MPMSGDWTTPMMWMRMPGQTWPGAAAAFVAMWIAMMVPMMLPAVGPVLWRDRDRMAMAGVRHPGVLSAIAGVGYFLVWAIVGAAAFPVGAISATALMHEPALARAAPLMVGVTVTMAGAIQLTSWKAHHLAQCRRESRSAASLPVGGAGAWIHGVQLGLFCVASCGNLMVIPLVAGAMDLRAMVAVGVAIAAERLAPNGERIARVIGVMLGAAGSFLVARAAGL